MNQIVALFGKADYLHTLLNSIPTHGLGLGAMALFFALITRSKEARFVALLVVFVSAAMAYPVYELGEAASDKLSAIADDEGTSWLEEHEHRAKQMVWMFYMLAGLSAAAIVAQRGPDKQGAIWAVVVLGLTGMTMGAGGYIAYAGGKIQHANFRVEPAPAHDLASAGEFHHN